MRSEVSFEGEVRLREVNYIGLFNLGLLDYIVSELHTKIVCLVLFVCNLSGYLRSEVSFERQVMSLEVNYICLLSLNLVDYIFFELEAKLHVVLLICRPVSYIIQMKSGYS